MSDSEDKKIKKREKIIKKHIKTLESQKKEKEISKEKLVNIKKESEKAISNIDQDITSINNELDLIISYDGRILSYTDNAWQTYERIYNHSVASEPTVKAFTYDVSKEEKDIKSLTATTISSNRLTTSDYLGVYGTLQSFYSDDKKFLKELEKEKPKDDFWNDVNFIKDEMNKEIPTSGDKFKKSIESFISSSEKYPTLLDIRSKIYYNFFDVLIPNESKYCKLNWFKKGLTKAKRYCQIKFYIQDGKEHKDLPRSTTTNINRVSMDMRKLFDTLSNLGKNGADNTKSEQIIKRELTPTLKSIFEIKI
jgi:hypothetical protein